MISITKLNSSPTEKQISEFENMFLKTPERKYTDLTITESPFKGFLKSSAIQESSPLKDLHPDLSFAINKLYRAAGLSITSQPKKENGSKGAKYVAHRLGINYQTVAFRVGKITPTRVGNFVTLWKRPNGKNKPIDLSDDVSFVVVDVSGVSGQKGQYIFDQDVLVKQKIFSVSSENQKGKMAFRVFPPWVNPKPSAIKTQEWQLHYFFPITSSEIPYSEIRRLFKAKV
ncbi:MAG: MepB family protein [Candidatus Neptunochlamydia sp.]|nr:MepB family protein [Candidatus Neptunochlamydia sp.]